MKTLQIAIPSILLLSCVVDFSYAQKDDKQILAKYRETSKSGGDAGRGMKVFASEKAACSKCHIVKGNERKAGPSLQTIGDKFTRDQLIQSVLEPSARIHPDHATTTVQTLAGKTIAGVLQSRSKKELKLFDINGKTVTIAVADIENEKQSRTSLMPAKLFETVTADQFADLIAYLQTLRQESNGRTWPGMPDEMPMVKKPARLHRLHSEAMKFDFPVCIISSPTAKGEYFVVEQKQRKIWRLIKGDAGFDSDEKKLFVDLSDEASTGQFEGVMCLAFHPDYKKNRKYYVNYHVRNQGSHFSPIIAERRAAVDFTKDAGGKSRRLMQIPQDTDLHWGGMLAFGPDGYLYIGAGDAGPQEDPEGHSQNLSLLTGAILRIDVDQQSDGRNYGIPDSNPFTSANKARPEIWAYGVRMPWRFSFDSATGDLWIGDIGQNLFESVRISRVGENHGWNVYEGFEKFSERYRRPNEKYVQPVLSYRRQHGVSVTGGYVYRAKKSSSYYGAYIFGDFESKRIWAMTQKDRKLVKVRQIGSCPDRICSFGLDEDGELLVIGYEGTIFRLDLSESVFE